SAYDCVLMSFAGHTVNHYMGLAAASDAYLYTRQGIAEVIKHVAPGGRIVSLYSNKVRLIASISAVAAEHGITDVSDKFMVSVPSQSPSLLFQAFDLMRLVYKAEGFTAAEIEQYKSGDRDLGWSPLYLPKGIDDGELPAEHR